MADYDPTIHMLIVDDDTHVLAVLEDLFADEPDIVVAAMSKSAEALDRIRRQKFDLVITDLMMPHVDGLAIAREAHRCSPGALVIIITGFASLETTLEAIKLGVYDYITKPFQVDEFRLLVSNASKRIRLEREVRALRERLGAAESRNAELQSICEGLSHEIDTLRHELERFGALNLDTGPASIRPVPRGEGKIGVYEKMANDFRIRLMHLREVVEAQNDTSAEP